MENIREWLKNPRISLVIGLVAGLLVGLIFAYLIWPVEYKDAAPAHLHPGYAADYLHMAITAYQANPADVVAAKSRWDALDEMGSTALEDVRKDPKGLNPAMIDAFAAAVGASAQAPGATQAPSSGGAEAESGANNTLLFVAIGVMCLVTIAVGGALVYFLFIKGNSGPTKVTPAMQAQQAARQAQTTDYAALGEEPPMAQFMASYKVGDDLFDESYSIDSATGEFMGECGVGISETIGVGDPKKVTAFEVWLFDKNDIQTVTRVLLSAHAFADEATKTRLKAKGDVEMAEVGKQVVLETQTLQLVARVVELTYGEGALPEKSFFDQFMLELAIWPK